MRARDKVSGPEPKLEQPKHTPQGVPDGQEGWDAGESSQAAGLWPVLESEGPRLNWGRLELLLSSSKASDRPEMMAGCRGDQGQRPD